MAVSAQPSRASSKASETISGQTSGRVMRGAAIARRDSSPSDRSGGRSPGTLGTIGTFGGLLSLLSLLSSLPAPASSCAARSIHLPIDASVNRRVDDEISRLSALRLAIARAGRFQPVRVDQEGKRSVQGLGFPHRR